MSRSKRLMLVPICILAAVSLPACSGSSSSSNKPSMSMAPSLSSSASQQGGQAKTDTTGSRPGGSGSIGTGGTQ